ncbi:cadmium resistance protein CadD (predicted permease) [Kitasatospora sp. GP30]|uniref:cadmium resistance transporter n=1 Tax=Kitasatospora sp. GP30 TaxID=3035084 RepID=UPI000C7153E6|nr:cadmium resistance transporter [Kitasatospora sp. GP30]MDH6143901.1 cadmium resistance protein CadD (predicted permease) [Kitasatospora sp. GP30]
MAGIARTAATAAGLFAGTNVDDLAVLAVLFLASRAGGTIRRRQIWVGQAAGFTVLVVASMVVALGLAAVPGGWIGLLGLIPLALGVVGLVRAARAHRGGEHVPVVPASGMASVMALTMVNGADNLSVYPPVFRTIGTGAALVTIAVFAAGVVVWCLLGSLLGSRRSIVKMVERWGHWIVPAAFVAIGVVLLLGSGVLTR